MKKILYSFMFLILIVCSSLNVGCDLSHKHYTDNFGVCKSCQNDISVLIKKDNNNDYIETEFNLQIHTDTYLKFISNGESQLTIRIECENANIKSIILYSKNDNYIASKYDSNNPVLICSEQLTADEEYYIKIESDKFATAKVILEA